MTRRTRPSGDIALGLAMRAAMEARGYTTRRLAVETGIDQARFRQWFGAHRKISYEDFKAFQAALGVDLAGVRHDRHSPHHMGYWCWVPLDRQPDLAVTCRSTGNVLWSWEGRQAEGRRP